MTFKCIWCALILAGVLVMPVFSADVAIIEEPFESLSKSPETPEKPDVTVEVWDWLDGSEEDEEETAGPPPEPFSTVKEAPKVGG